MRQHDLGIFPVEQKAERLRATSLQRLPGNLVTRQPSVTLDR